MRRALYIRDIHLARLALDDERISRLFLLLERHRPPPGEEDLRGFEWRYLWGRCHQAKRVLRGHPELVSRVVFTPDGKCLLAAGHEGTLEMWDADSGEPRGLPWQERGRILSLVFAPEGRTLITGGKDGEACACAIGRAGGRELFFPPTRRQCIPWGSLPMAKRWPPAERRDE